MNLGLKLGYDGVVGNGKFNLAAGAMLQDKPVSAAAGGSQTTKIGTFGLQGNLGSKQGGGTQDGGLLTVTIPL